jgi:hypothetical protein
LADAFEMLLVEDFKESDSGFSVCGVVSGIEVQVSTRIEVFVVCGNEVPSRVGPPKDLGLMRSTVFFGLVLTEIILKKQDNAGAN